MLAPLSVGATAGAQRSSGVSPVRRATRASILGPISTLSWNAKTNIGPSLTGEDFVRSSELALDRPPDTKKRGQDAPRLCRRPDAHERKLGRAEGHTDQIGSGFAVFEAVGQITKRECFGARQCFIARLTVCENAWKVCNLGDPATVFFALEFDCEMHRESGWDCCNVAPTLVRDLTRMRQQP